MFGCDTLSLKFDSQLHLREDEANFLTSKFTNYDKKIIFFILQSKTNSSDSALIRISALII